MSYRAPLYGLGQAKATSGGTDHTATDVASVISAFGPLVGGIVGGATGTQTGATSAQQQAIQQQQYAAPASTGIDWYWPVLGVLGVVMAGGIFYMVTKKPKPAAKATANKRSRRNGWRRKASKAWRGKRRSRAKRAA